MKATVNERGKNETLWYQVHCFPNSRNITDFFKKIIHFSLSEKARASRSEMNNVTT